MPNSDAKRLTKVSHVAGGSMKFMLDLTSVKLPDQLFVFLYPKKTCYPFISLLQGQRFVSV
jgi:hypothetical protein